MYLCERQDPVVIFVPGATVNANVLPGTGMSAVYACAFAGQAGPRE